MLRKEAHNGHRTAKPAGCFVGLRLHLSVLAQDANRPNLLRQAMDLVLDKLQRLVYVDSSNPCWLYLDLSRAVHQKDVGSRLIRDLKAQMLRSIGSSSLPAADAHNLKAHVTTAALAEFRSEVWRLDLNKISINRGKPLSVLKTDWRNNAQNEITKNPPQVLQSDEYL